MNKEPIFKWDEETGVATCTMFDPDTGEAVTTMATCAADDKDMQSEKTGCEIALRRAMLKILRKKIKRLNFEYKVLDDLLKVYKYRDGGNLDKNNPYIKILFRKINAIELDNEQYKATYIEGIKSLSKYIADKDHFYKVTRANRAN